MNDPTGTGATQPSPEPLCPISRTGIRGSAGIILHLMLLLAAITVGVGICAMRTTSQWERNIAEGISVAALILMTLHLWRITRRARGVVPVLVLSAGLLIYLTDGSFIPAAVLVGIVFAVSEGSIALAVAPKGHLWWFPLIPLTAYGVTALVSRDPIGASAALIPFPAMPVLAISTRHSAERERGITRVGVICATALALGLSLLAMVALSLYRQLGSLQITVLSDALDTFRKSAIDSIVALEVPEELQKLTTPENAANMVNGLINLAPGYAVVAVLLITTVAQFIQHAGLAAFGFGASVTERVRVFRMSTVSCFVFVITYLIALVSDSAASTLTSTVAQNIYIVLLPGLAFSGLIRLATGLTRRGVRGMGCLFYLIIFIPLLLFIAPFLLAAVEVIGRAAAWISQKTRTPDGPKS